jgi:hypothetical protein
MKNNTTFVTCYYKIKSKQSASVYLNWIDNMLTILNVPIILYTNIETSLLLTAYASKIKIVIIEICDFYSNKYHNGFELSYEQDIKRKHLHSVDLFKIYNEKANFLKLAIDDNYFNTSFFYWIDIGCFRPEVTHLNYPDLHNWPNFNKLSRDKINMFSVNEININDRILDLNMMTNDTLRTQGNAKIVGGFFGGRVDKILLYISEYYYLLEQWNLHEKFIGIDNYIMTNIFLKLEDECNLLSKDSTHMNHITDTHMWFQNYLM